MASEKPQGAHTWREGLSEEETFALVGVSVGMRCNIAQYKLLCRCSKAKDMTEWDDWRIANPDEEVRLQGADLDVAHLKRELLGYPHLGGVALAGAPPWMLAGVHLEAAYVHSAHLEGADLGRARLEGADLRLADLKGADLAEAHLEGAELEGARLEGADLHRAHLEGADLMAAHLEGVRLRSAHLEGAGLFAAHLEGADLIGAHLEGASLGFAHLEGADLRSADLKGADLRKAHLEGAWLHEARLEGVDLMEAHLEGAKLHQAHLEGAALVGTHLEGADLSFAIVDGATLFEDCTVDRKTDFTGVGLGACRMDQGFKNTLEYNMRRKHRHDDVSWLDPRKWLKWPFWWVCDFGRSTWRIVWCFLVLSLAFAVAYFTCGICAHPGAVDGLFQDEAGLVGGPGHVFVRSLYFSVVTMTTLGFGDMHAFARNPFGHWLLMGQVICGYFLLGALICRINILFHATGSRHHFTRPPLLWRLVRPCAWLGVPILACGIWYNWAVSKWPEVQQRAQQLRQRELAAGTAGEYFHVLRVIDGDTFVIRYDGEPTSVRLWDIDAPELDEPGGPAAVAELRRLIDNRDVRIVLCGPRKRDSFGRLLARVFVDDVEVSQAMLHSGLVAAYAGRKP